MVREREFQALRVYIECDTRIHVHRERYTKCTLCDTPCDIMYMKCDAHFIHKV